MKGCRRRKVKYQSKKRNATNKRAKPRQVASRKSFMPYHYLSTHAQFLVGCLVKTNMWFILETILHQQSLATRSHLKNKVIDNICLWLSNFDQFHRHVSFHETKPIKEGPTLEFNFLKPNTCQGENYFALAYKTPIQNQHFQMCVMSCITSWSFN